jgi:FkbM family methyltransferase
MRIAGLTLRYDDPRSLAFEFKHIFVQRLYDFRPTRPRPRVLDGGGHIGLSALRFRRLAPDAQITVFEPDPAIVPMLRENLATNGADDVSVVAAALAGNAGTASFAPDGIDGGALSSRPDAPLIDVPAVRLSEYLTTPVDFLKLNIEGAELDVIREAGAALANVRQLAIEYHGFPELGERLGELLTRLARAGFRTVVHAFDRATNPAGHPPFRIHAGTRWFALVAAFRDEQ